MNVGERRVPCLDAPTVGLETCAHELMCSCADRNGYGLHGYSPTSKHAEVVFRSFKGRVLQTGCWLIAWRGQVQWNLGMGAHGLPTECMVRVR